MSGDSASFSVDIGGMRAKYKGESEAFTEENLKGKEPFSQFREWFDEACKHPSILEANAVCLATATRDGIPSARQVLLKGYGKDGFRFFTNYDSRKGRELAENPRAALNFYWEPLKKAVRVEGYVEKVSASESDDYFHSRPLPSQIGAVVSDQSRPIASRDVLIKREAVMVEQYGDGSKQVPRPKHWTTYRSHLQESSSARRSLKMGPKGCPETSITNYHSTVLKIPEEGRSHLLCSRSLKSRKSQLIFGGGYMVVPEVIEFWQGQTNRMHDRIRFRRQKTGDEPDGILLHQGDCGWVYERLSP